MKLNKEEQKNIAVERLNQLNVYKPYVRSFKAKKQTVTMFENFGGFYATADNGEEELENKIRDIEANTNSIVYAVTHEVTEFGDCYSLLLVTNEEDETRLEQDRNVFFPLAYVWNKTCEDCSEFGTIGVTSFGGGLKRVY